MNSKRNGYGISGSSYDVRQKINAKVIGVLRYNNDIRSSLMSRNIGMYTHAHLDEGIGYISNLYSLETSKPFSLGEDGLLGYTHINESSYQKKISHIYGFGDVIEYYKHNYNSRQGYLRQYNNYNDYLSFIDDVTGGNIPFLSFMHNIFNSSTPYVGNEEQMTVQSVLYNFIQNDTSGLFGRYDDMQFALQKDRIGTVTPDPIGALSGVVTTNINSLTGTDTPLGLITNNVYANTLRNSAYFNSIRNTRYITPSVYQQLGNKTNTIHYLSSLGNEFITDSIESRLSEDFSYDLSVRYIEHLPDISNERDRVIDNSDNIDTLYENISRNIYNIFNVNNSINQYQSYYNPNDNTRTVRGAADIVVGNKLYYSWDEGDIFGVEPNVTSFHYQETNRGYIEDVINENSILNKTQKLFTSHNENGIDTLVGRFHTSGGHDKTHNEVSLLQSAVTSFGMSHGRNLLTEAAYKYNMKPKTNGYSNPYCRVWTYHNQYEKINNLIRPFSEDESILDVSDIQSSWWRFGRRKGSAQRLSDNSSLNRNGFVNITPTNNDSENAVDIKQCMFSIENLAWKDVKTDIENGIKPLSPEQIGPNGGRIMWFPPYDLKFNESVQVQWQPNDFIGRGEKIYTYTNTDRSGTLSFILLVDHPSIVDMWKKNGATGNVQDDEQSLLRFFAGCSTLKLNDADGYIHPDIIVPEKEDEPIPYIEDNNTEDIIFYIFFPNNYAISDIPGDNDKFDYLINNYESKKDGNLGILYEGYKWQYPVENEESFKVLKENLLETNYKNNGNSHLNSSIREAGYEDATNSLYEIATGNVLKNKMVVSARIEGYASNHGYKKNNEELIRRRVKFAGEFLRKKLGIEVEINADMDEKERLLPGSIINVDDNDCQNISGLSAKKARCAKVILTTKNTNVTDDLKDSLVPTVTTNISKDVSLVMNPNSFNYYGELTKQQQRAKNLSESIVDINDSIKTQMEQISIITKEYNISTVRRSGNELKDLSLKLTQQKEDEALEEIRKNKEEINELNNNATPQRWDAEAQYFSMLQDNDYFTYSRIIDKIKYFIPAYHSITPEGFNARLGFLHQCTRQGMTRSTSDMNTFASAGNLAFGRPPICVLRIGDFYHTKIIIESVTIDYENSQWDLNPEGIGIQPTFARVSLQFKFLGGSDLEAPIARLQNAVSFNYYANQSVYDDRSDIGIYDTSKQKPIISGTPWKPSLKNNYK